MSEKVIEFPQRRARKVIEARKNESRQALMALSLVSLVLVAVFANEQVLKDQRPLYIISDNSGSNAPGRIQDLNRAIASARPLNPLRDLEWEQQLAKKLGPEPQATASAVSDERSPASFGRQASVLDQVRFGALAGKYRLSIKNINGEERLEAIEYIDSLESGDRPQMLDRAQFLRDYRTVFAVNFSRLEYQKLEGSTEVYSLEDEAQHEVARALITVDDEGRFLNLRFADSSVNGK